MCWNTTQAWSVLGHRRIAEVARAVLKEKQRRRVSQMLEGDVVELANWEEVMTSAHPETDTLHWHRQDPEWTCQGFGGQNNGTVASIGEEENMFHSLSSMLLKHLGDKTGHVRCDGHGVEGGSLFCALAYFFEHFAHDALLREFQKPKDPINTPSKLPALARLKQHELGPAQYLRWLAVLIGDLHQPLHWLREHNYGRDVMLLYGGREHSLFAVWEELIPQQLPALPPQKQLERRYQEQAPAWWDKVPPELFREWAKEMAETVCRQVYATVEVRPGGNRSAGELFRLDEATFQGWVKLAHNFTTLGGERLAFVFREILEHRRHKTAHKEGRGRHHRKKNWATGLGINASIAVVVVPLLLAGFWLHAHNGNSSLRDLFAHVKI